MTKLVAAVVALGVALAFTAPAFAADVAKAKTEADCTKAGGVWDAKGKTCKPKM
jgi:predicted secreted protein